MHDRQDIRCEVVENNKRCNRGVRNIKRMMCSMHYARWQRTGTTDTNQKNQRRSLSAQRKVERIKSEGGSVMCLCTHGVYVHRQGMGCKEEHCRCSKFNSANSKLLESVLAKMATVGFSDPINDSAWCASCQAYIVVGTWHDQHVIGRMREHLRVTHLFRRNLRAVPSD